jgi:hypothetical protein
LVALLREEGDIMARGRRYWSLAIVIVVTVLDIFGRLALAFDMPRIVAVEAVLFVAACLLISVIVTQYKLAYGLLARAERGLAVVFGLGGLRAAVWAVGGSVVLANLVAFFAGVALVVGYIVGKRVLRRRQAI